MEKFSQKIKDKKAFVDDGIDYNKPQYKSGKGFKNLIDILEAFIYAILAVLFIFTFFLRLTVVNGSSMDNTLHENDYLVVANVFFSYEPEQGDIVVIHGNFPNYITNNHNNQYTVVADYSDPIVKRVIATEGQKIKINFVTSEIFVDGNKLTEDYIRDDYIFPFENSNTFLRQFKVDKNGEFVRDKNGNIVCENCYDPSTGILEATVPQGHIFVMGDNRNNSADSRHRDIGFIPEEFIVGKAIFRLSPFTTF